MTQPTPSMNQPRQRISCDIGPRAELNEAALRQLIATHAVSSVRAVRYPEDDSALYCIEVILSASGC